MAIFGTSGFNYSEPLDIENMTYIESTMDNHFEAGVRLMAESEENFNNIMKAIAIYELNVLESTGQEVIYEAVDLSSILRKFKEFFKKLWEKVKGIFKKFFAMLDSMTMSDKEFVSKYKKDLQNVKSTRDFEYKGFKFTHLGESQIPDIRTMSNEMRSVLSIKNDNDPYNLEKYVKQFEDDKYDKVIDGYRGQLLGKNTRVYSEDFHQDLFEYFRDGESEKVVIDKVDITELLSLISNSSDSKKKAENSLKAFKDKIDPIIKEYEEAEKEAMRGVPGNNQGEGKLNSAKASAYAKTSKIYQDCLAAAQLFTTAKLQAIKDEKRQAKSVCVKLLTYKPKNESAGFVHTEGGSFLDNVVIR